MGSTNDTEILWSDAFTGLKIVTDTVTNATNNNIFSLPTKNSGSVATLVTRFLYDLDPNWKSKVKTNNTDFCPQYFQTITSDGSHSTMSCIIYLIQTDD